MPPEIPKPDLNDTSAIELANLVQVGRVELSEIPHINRGDVKFILKTRADAAIAIVQA